ncbi:MAG: deaminase [Candidatus Paceibacterota bacterium]|jgi:dCMP deaminase
MQIKRNNLKKKIEVIIAYVPVLHEGYRRFFEKHPKADALYLLSSDITKEFVPLVKDIRALPPEMIRDSLIAWKRFKKIEIIDSSDLKKVAGNRKVIMPDEDVMHEIKEKFLPDLEIIFDTIFLRWDKHKSSEGQPVDVDQTISVKDSDQEIIALLKAEAEKSSDFWRHIGAAIMKDGKIVLQGHNHHVPSEQTPYVDGDPRSDFHKGVNLELSTAIHAEASLIAEAARKGIKLEGAEMYATTFPCPPCAKLIAYSGIKKLYYADGYGVLDAAKILKSRGVEIVFVRK